MVPRACPLVKVAVRRLTRRDVPSILASVRRAVSAVLCAALLSLTTAAAAQSPQDLARAQRLFDEGDRAEQKGDCRLAIEKFSAAMAVIETPQLRLRSGRCHEKLNELREALVDYERARALAKDDEELASLARRQAALVKARFPSIKLEAPLPMPDGLAITLDGAAISDVSERQIVDAGSHTIRATAPGFLPFEETVNLSNGQLLEVKIALARPPPPPKPEISSTAWILLGSGGGALVLSVAFGVHSYRLKEEGQEIAARNGCTGDGGSLTCAGDVEGTPDGEELKDLEVQQNVFVGLSAGTAVAAAALVAAGVAYIFVPDEAAKRTALLPWVGADSFGLVLHGSLF